MSDNAISAQGTEVYVSSGSGGAITITAITEAYRAEVTGTNTLEAGDRVTFASVSGMTEINTLVGTVITATTSAFVVDIDSRAFTAYTSGGTATPVTWTQILEVKDFSPSGATVSEIDVTDLSSTAKEFRGGLMDNGSFTLNINYLETDPGQIAAKAAFSASTQKSFKVVDPVDTVYTFDGYISNFNTIPTAAIDGVLTGTITVRISGSVTVS